jgi:predicted transcriptional regulator
MGKDGIAAKTGLDSNQIARRMSEMHQMGVVVLTGKTVLSEAGRQEREWAIVSG